MGGIVKFQPCASCSSIWTATFWSVDKLLFLRRDDIVTAANGEVLEGYSMNLPTSSKSKQSILWTAVADFIHSRCPSLFTKVKVQHRYTPESGQMFVAPETRTPAKALSRGELLSQAFSDLALNRQCEEETNVVFPQTEMQIKGKNLRPCAHSSGMDRCPLSNLSKKDILPFKVVKPTTDEVNQAYLENFHKHDPLKAPTLASEPAEAAEAGARTVDDESDLSNLYPMGWRDSSSDWTEEDWYKSKSSK